MQNDGPFDLGEVRGSRADESPIGYRGGEIGKEVPGPRAPAGD